MTEKQLQLYADRDAIRQGDIYVDHILAMSVENLNGKAEIASEFAHRDIVINDLVKSLEKCLLITKMSVFNNGKSISNPCGRVDGIDEIIEEAEKALQKNGA